MEKKEYKIEKSSPGLGEAGASVKMTETQAKYLLLSGVLGDPARAQPASKKTKTKKEKA